MELDSYGIYFYFTGDVRSIPIDHIQKVSIGTNSIKTDRGEIVIQTKLGEGTYGKTYATTTGAAIKIVQLQNTEDIYNTLGEAIMNIILFEGTEYEKDGPCVPEVYEFGLTADLKTAIIHYERMTGTLFEYLKTKTPSENNKIVPETILKLLNICEFLERRFQFNHRDFKSDNVMYVLKKGKPVWRIIDLGAACMNWNGGFRIASDLVFPPSRPCVRTGRDMTFLITDLVLEVPLSPQLDSVLRTLIAIQVHGKECALNLMDCEHADYKKWENIYDLLNSSNALNPNYALIRSTLTQFLKKSVQTQKLKRPFWNFTFRKPKHERRRTRRLSSHYIL
jgi:serine/threonine protein kinase